MQSFDVIIAGGGMVGLALACGLQGSGLRVAVLEQRQPDMVPPSEQPALRVSAINAASERLLQHIGVWDDILQLRASAYNAMEVWERDSFGKIAFRGDECGFSHLGHIIENAVIQQALWKRAESLSDITLITPAALKQVAWGENDAFVTLEDGRMLTARLVIGADGAPVVAAPACRYPAHFLGLPPPCAGCHHSHRRTASGDGAANFPRRRHSGVPAVQRSAFELHRLVGDAGRRRAAQTA